MNIAYLICTCYLILCELRLFTNNVLYEMLPLLLLVAYYIECILTLFVSMSLYSYLYTNDSQADIEE